MYCVPTVSSLSWLLHACLLYVCKIILILANKEHTKVHKLTHLQIELELEHFHYIAKSKSDHFSSRACLLIQKGISVTLNPVSPPRMFVMQRAVYYPKWLVLVSSEHHCICSSGKGSSETLLRSQKCSVHCTASFIIYLNGWLSHHHLLRL